MASQQVGSLMTPCFLFCMLPYHRNCRFELLTFGKVKPFDLSVFNCAPSKAARLLAESGQRPNLGKVDLNLIPSELLHMAKDCWSAEAWNRPSFSVIVNTIERQLRLLQAHIYSQPPTPDMEGHQ